jgi:4-hydroxybenzoate polyprenyltransferase
MATTPTTPARPALVPELLGLIRFSHTLFALPFALASAVLAWRAAPMRPLDVVGILVCMILARSFAMALNRLADQRFDALNPRTAGRHLPAGRLGRGTVWAFTVLCAAGFVATTGLFAVAGNWLPLILAVPVLAFVAGYSWAKRFTALCHFWLGAALCLAPVAAWIAIRGTVEWPPVVLGLAVLTWVAGFDILYACQDVDFDRQAGLHSVPARLGVAGALRLALACHALMVVALVALWWVAGLGAVYLGGVAVVAALLLYEHALVRPDDLTRVNQAFFNVNVVISLGLFGLILLDVWLGHG